MKQGGATTLCQHLQDVAGLVAHPLPQLLPVLSTLHALLQQCRFPRFWALYRSGEVENLRDNYTVECVGFEDAVRQVAVRAVKAAFTSIGSERLGTYLDLSGTRGTDTRLKEKGMSAHFPAGADLNA